MELKTLEFDIGALRTLQGNTGLLTPQGELAPGWYVDPVSGQRIFYDAVTQNFYTLAGGVFIPLAYMNPAPKQVTLAPGDKLKVTISYKYSGPAVSGVIERFCAGAYGIFGFTENLVGENSRNLPSSPTPQLYTGEYTFTIPAGVGADWNDIYCKVYGGSPAVPQTLFGYENALVIVGKEPAISEFSIVDFVKV